MAVRFTFGKCKTRAAYSAKLQQKGRLNLKKVKEAFGTILETPILIVVKINGIEIIVHGHGELIFKNCEDVAWMEKTAEEIYKRGMGS